MTDIVRAEAESIPDNQNISTTISPEFSETKSGIARSGDL